MSARRRRARWTRSTSCCTAGASLEALHAAADFGGPSSHGQRNGRVFASITATDLAEAHYRARKTALGGLETEKNEEMGHVRAYARASRAADLATQGAPPDGRDARWLARGAEAGAVGRPPARRAA